MRRLLLVLVLAASGLLAACHPVPAPAATPNWDAVAQCETGQNWAMTGPTYSGGLGFANSSWSAYAAQAVHDGKALYLPGNAGEASREEQIIVATEIQIANGGRLRGSWGCWQAGGVG